jgi:hypothetical protein
MTLSPPSQPNLPSPLEAFYGSIFAEKGRITTSGPLPQKKTAGELRCQSVVPGAPAFKPFYLFRLIPAKKQPSREGFFFGSGRKPRNAN